jgi:hypothetical protein
VGVARFRYADGRVLEQVLPDKGSPNLPELFTSAEAATRAAETHAQAFRLSEWTERLTGMYGGDS